MRREIKKLESMFFLKKKSIIVYLIDIKDSYGTKYVNIGNFKASD